MAACCLLMYPRIIYRDNSCGMSLKMLQAKANTNTNTKTNDMCREIRILSERPVSMFACVCVCVWLCYCFFSSFVDYLSKFINLVAYVRNTLASVVSTPNNAQLLKIDASSISFGVSWAFVAFHFQFDLFL